MTASPSPISDDELAQLGRQFAGYAKAWRKLHPGIADDFEKAIRTFSALRAERARVAELEKQLAEADAVIARTGSTINYEWAISAAIARDRARTESEKQT